MNASSVEEMSIVAWQRSDFIVVSIAQEAYWALFILIWKGIVLFRKIIELLFEKTLHKLRGRWDPLWPLTSSGIVA